MIEVRITRETKAPRPERIETRLFGTFRSAEAWVYERLPDCEAGIVYDMLPPVYTYFSRTENLGATIQERAFPALEDDYDGVVLD